MRVAERLHSEWSLSWKILRRLRSSRGWTCKLPNLAYVDGLRCCYCATIRIGDEFGKGAKVRRSGSRRWRKHRSRSATCPKARSSVVLRISVVCDGLEPLAKPQNGLVSLVSSQHLFNTHHYIQIQSRPSCYARIHSRAFPGISAASNHDYEVRNLNSYATS